MQCDIQKWVRKDPVSSRRGLNSIYSSTTNLTLFSCFMLQSPTLNSRYGIVSRSTFKWIRDSGNERKISTFLIGRWIGFRKSVTSVRQVRYIGRRSISMCLRVRHLISIPASGNLTFMDIQIVLDQTRAGLYRFWISRSIIQFSFSLSLSLTLSLSLFRLVRA